MTGLFSPTTRKPLAVLLSVLVLAGVGSTAGAIALAAPAHAQQDLRSPDARDAAMADAAGQDLRSPDARDAATNPQSTSVRVVPITRTVRLTSDDFEWGDAAIGAAGTLALILVLAGTTVAWTRHRLTAAA